MRKIREKAFQDGSSIQLDGGFDGHDVIFIMGDLNFRINMTRDEVDEIIDDPPVSSAKSAEQATA